MDEFYVQKVPSYWEVEFSWTQWLFGIKWVRRRDVHISGFVVIGLGPLEVAWHGSLLVRKRRRNPA